MRGTLKEIGVEGLIERITPAHAGNTLIEKAKAFIQRDHPRPCGEHRAYSVAPTTLIGSPPPMRGTRGTCDYCKFTKGITPAHAGNTRQ